MLSSERAPLKMKVNARFEPPASAADCSMLVLVHSAKNNAHIYQKKKREGNLDDLSIVYLHAAVKRAMDLCRGGASLKGLY